MARGTKGGPDAWSHLHRGVEESDREALNHSARVFSGIEWEGRGMFREPLAIGVSGVFLLQMSAVRQHNAAEVLGALGGEDSPLEAVPVERRKVSGVVEMGMRE
jgi:hypothetical protein